MRQHIEFQINPLRVPMVAQRIAMIRGYAERYVMYGKDHESLRSFVEQVKLDMKDRTIGPELKQEIRRLEKGRLAREITRKGRE